MKKIWIAPLLLSVVAASCLFNGRRVNGNGHVTTEDRPATNFTGVQLSSSYDVYLTEGSNFSVKVEGEDNILPYVRTEVRNGTLEIETRDNVWLNTHRDVKIYVTAPSYEKIYLTGSGDISSQTKLTSASKMALDLTGSGNLKVVLDAPEVKADVTGSGDMELQGDTKKFDSKISGSGNINAQELKAEESSVHITGSGDARVYCSVKLQANITGSGDVYYKGNGAVNSNITGSGEVKKVE
jgi:hypothetical protein